MQIVKRGVRCLSPFLLLVLTSTLHAASSKSPELSLQASTNEVDAGESVLLMWSSVNARNCQGTGALAGPLPANGRKGVPNIRTSTTFSMSCDSAVGKLVASTGVLVSGGAEPNQPQAAKVAKIEPTSTPTYEKPPVKAVLKEGNTSSTPARAKPQPVKVVASGAAPRKEIPSADLNELAAQAVYADQNVENCNTYHPPTQTCGAGSNRVFSSLEEATAALLPGDTLYVMGGTSETDPKSIWQSATYRNLEPQLPTVPSEPITISSYPGHTVILQGVSADNDIDLDSDRHYLFVDLSMRKQQKSGRNTCAKPAANT